MIKPICRFLVLFSVYTSFNPPCMAENIIFPDDAGIVDVTQPPYNAQGDGLSDDTQALQQALTDHPAGDVIIYLPNGTYLISNTLTWPEGAHGGFYMKKTILQGQSTAGTILKLKDNCEGYQDPNNKKHMIFTGEPPAQRFRNALRNFTVNSGSGNPGCSAVRFYANNQGCMRNVNIVSGDGQGFAGLDLSSGENGPALIKDVMISGFDYGIYTSALNSITIEHLTLENQNVFGIMNTFEVLNIRDLKSSNNVPVIKNNQFRGLILLVDAELNGYGDAINRPAIINEKSHPTLEDFLFVRNVKTRGYAQAIWNNTGDSLDVVGPDVEEFSSHPITNVFPSPQHSLNLEIKETPEIPWGDLSEWTSPLEFGGIPDDGIDDTWAIQDAIDSGAKTVYLPNGMWTINGTINLRNNLHRLMGCEARLEGNGLIRLTNDGAAPAVIVERFGNKHSEICEVEQASDRTLVISSCSIGYRENTIGFGDVFIEDVVGKGFAFNHQNVWARQLNTEPEGLKITNNGSNLWVLGLKTERRGTVIKTENNGNTELLGAHFYVTGDPQDDYMFINDESSVSITAGELGWSMNYHNIIKETRDGIVRTLTNDAFPKKGGVAITLYVGYKDRGKGWNISPAIALKNPLTRQRYELDEPVVFQADASDSDGQVVRVEYFINGKNVGQSLAPPFDFEWTGSAYGTHELYAKAIDDDGASMFTDPIFFFVGNQLPDVSIQYPFARRVFDSGMDLMVSIKATDPDGEIDRVELLVDSTKIGEDHQAPFEISWLGPLPGQYLIAAKAYDKDGGESLSESIPVTMLNPELNGLVGHWALDDGSGSAVSDSTGNGFDAYNRRGAWITGIRKGAISLARPSSYIRLPKYTLSSDEGSISMWFRTDANFTNPAFLFYGSETMQGDGGGPESELHLNFDAAEKIELFIEGGEQDVRIKSEKAFSDGAWHHVAATWQKGNEARLFIDGQLIGSAPHLAKDFPFCGEIFIGRSNKDGYWPGAVDEIRMFNRSLTIDEISVLAQKRIEIELTSPLDNASYNRGIDIPLVAEIMTSQSVEIIRVEFLANGEMIGQDETEPFEWIWTGANVGEYSLTAQVIEKDGTTTVSNTVSIEVRDPADPGLIAHWMFNESEGEILTDASGNGHQGELEGPLRVKGVRGNALQFNGISDFVKLPNSILNSELGSISLWLKTSHDYVDSQGHIIYGSDAGGGNGNGDQNEMHITMQRGSNVVLCYIEGGSADLRLESPLALNDDNWHHVAFTWQKDRLARLYVDGIRVDSVQHDAHVFDCSAITTLGIPGSHTRYFDGLVDDVRVFDKALSVNEIEVLFGVNSGYPAGWMHMDLGDVAVSGDAIEQAGAFTLYASGYDIWDNSDEFHYVYWPLQGDGEIIACVESQTHTNEWAKAGVMIRESLSADSRHVNVIMTPANGKSLQWREEPAEKSFGGNKLFDDKKYPAFLRLLRTGDVFTGSKSTDGQTWVELGRVTIPMEQDVYIGLSLTAHNDGVICTAVFSDVKVRNTSTRIPSRDASTVDSFVLQQNYPNPFNPTTTICYQLAGPTHASLKIFNLLGKEIVTLAEGSHRAGTYQAIWDGKDQFGLTVAAGVYIYRLQANSFVQTRKLLLLK